MDEQLRVGLIGAGNWAQRIHAPGLANHPGVRFTSVWARRRDAAESVAHSYCAEIADDPSSLIDSVDAVAFAVPPAVQAELALQAVKAGKHVIVEKPLAASLGEAERLAGAIADAGVASLVALIRRFAHETVEWLDDLRSHGGWVGGNAQWMSGALLSDDYVNSAWRHESGALLDIGPHVIDLMDAALGQVTDVVAATRGPLDLWHILLAHAGGATSTITMSLKMPLRPTVVDFSVYGDYGYRRLPGRVGPADQCYAALLDDFVAMVHSDTTSHPCDAQRGLHLQRLIATITERTRTLAG
ncbi:putative dehydrogenase [Kibdelosporangium banguiense]|uniref:Dehydrogenase n=1 Tax=Kibdelosporangium banguiense TaxID=1365924 RepID=A0ABS4TAL7_9PSEU|nr:Gfo/Idh/MocA family oxidoreductase [Kibdelosporangium banguiense]MBP2321466.1 putative dehydrogenase [Kibdelosporangium banguiense]